MDRAQRKAAKRKRKATRDRQQAQQAREQQAREHRATRASAGLGDPDYRGSTSRPLDNVYSEWDQLPGHFESRS